MCNTTLFKLGSQYFTLRRYTLLLVVKWHAFCSWLVVRLIRCEIQGVSYISVFF